MWSFSRGKPVGRIEGGEHDGKIIHLFTPDMNQKCCTKCTSNCKKRKCCEKCQVRSGGCLECNKDGELVADIRMKNPYEVVNEQYFRNKKKRMTLFELEKLRRALMENREPFEDDLSKIYHEARKHINSIQKFEIKLKDGKIVPLPKQDDNEADHIYVAGPTGSGKSTFAGNWLNEIKKVFPKKTFIVFSNFSEDFPLDKHKPYRIKMDESLIKQPIKKEELKNSVCIFDDIDTLPPKIAHAVQHLRNDLLQCGRKEHIKVICTSHQLMNYNKTRDVLNSCQKIIFFPQATAQYHMKRFLKEYCGLTSNQSQTLLHLPTRWIMIDKHYPTFCMYESGCIILNKMEKGIPVKHERLINDDDDSDTDTDSDGDILI